MFNKKNHRVIALNLSLATGFLLSASMNVKASEESESVTFKDIVSDVSMGLDYRRTESARDVIWDQLKSQPVVTMFDLALVPLKSRGAPGVAILDYDKDGDMDMYITNGPGSANSLYSNQLKETGELSFIDMASYAGVGAADMDSAGVCYGDIDNDGDHDLYVLSSGESNRLFENQGDGTFNDITVSSGMSAGARYPASCAMGDVNGDGLLDVAIANTSDTWDNRIAIFNAFGFNDHNQLFLNQADNKFEDVSVTSGIKELAGFPEHAAGAAGVTWAISLVDYDQDGDVDIVSVDDQGGGVLPEIQGGVDRGFIHVMKNDGTGKFTDVSVEVGTNLYGDWKGLSFGDLNSDGHMDIFATNVGDYVLSVFPRPLPYELGTYASRWFMGQPDGTFKEPGLGTVVSTVFGWGTVMTDYNNDGDTDIIYYGGGDGGPLIEASNPGVLMQNDGNANFKYDLQALVGSTNHSERMVQGLAAGDLNNDGFIDLVSVSSADTPAPMPLVPYPVQWGSDADATAFFFPAFTPISQTEFVWNGMDPVDGTLSVEINSADNEKHWAKIELMGTVGIVEGARVNRDAIGAIVYFTPEEGKTIMQPVLGGASYASQDSLVVNVGLGEADEGTVDVLWPGGVRNRYYGLKASEKILLPEIPCSYDASWKGKKYLSCVRDALKDLVSEDIITKAEKARLMASAARAFFKGRHKDAVYKKHD